MRVSLTKKIKLWLCLLSSETQFEMTYNSKFISNLRWHNEVLILAFTLYYTHSRLNDKLLTCTLLALNLTVHSQCLIFELSKPKKSNEIKDNKGYHFMLNTTREYVMNHMCLLLTEAAVLHVFYWKGFFKHLHNLLENSRHGLQKIVGHFQNTAASTLIHFMSPFSFYTPWKH